MTVRSAAPDKAQPSRRPAYALRYASFESRLVAAVLDLLVVFIAATSSGLRQIVNLCIC